MKNLDHLGGRVKEKKEEGTEITGLSYSEVAREICYGKSGKGCKDQSLKILPGSLCWG